MADALIIFVRNPELGKVKTRLAATLGEDKALEIYQQLLMHTWDITKNIAAEKYVLYADEIRETDMWKEAGYHRLLQMDSDLGEKMLAAFKMVFDKNNSKVIIIGSDCIELTAAIIQEALLQLNINDVVIGPANDGGYYLLGMKKLHIEFFFDKQWSTDKVYSATITDFKKAGLLYFELPVLIDVDTEEDWQLVQKSARNNS